MGEAKVAAEKTKAAAEAKIAAEAEAKITLEKAKAEAEAKITADKAKAAVEAKSAEALPVDEGEHCYAWAEAGECTKNVKYMLKNCKQNCSDYMRRRVEEKAAQR